MTPNAYTGPEWYDADTDADVLNKLQEVETWGLGYLTADVLSVDGGGKIFGVLG